MFTLYQIQSMKTSPQTRFPSGLWNLKHVEYVSGIYCIKFPSILRHCSLYRYLTPFNQMCGKLRALVCSQAVSESGVHSVPL